jgi:hypothetical protein
VLPALRVGLRSGEQNRYRHAGAPTCGPADRCPVRPTPVRPPRDPAARWWSGGSAAALGEGSLSVAEPNPVLRDREWLYQRYHVDRAPIAEIARRARADVCTVYRALLRHDIPKRCKLGTRRGSWGDVLTTEVLAALLAQPRPYSELAAEVGCDHMTLVYWGVRRGLIDYDMTPAEAEKLRSLYQAGASTREVAERLGLSRKTATARLVAAGAALRPPGRPAGHPSQQQGSSTGGRARRQAGTSPARPAGGGQAVGQGQPLQVQTPPIPPAPSGPAAGMLLRLLTAGTPPAEEAPSPRSRWDASATGR